MDAFAFSLLLLCVAALLGRSLLIIFPPYLNTLQEILIAPSVGFALMVVPTFVLNRMGLPVQSFGPALALFMLLTSWWVLKRKRPDWWLPSSAQHLGFVLLGLFLVGRPMLSFGFDWISFANDDMANYALGAQRFFYHGFFEPMKVTSFFEGSDASQAFWFMHVHDQSRSGSELLLALLWSLTSLNPHQLFMPVMCALHASFIASSAALLHQSHLPKKSSLWLACLMAVSPLSTLGVLYSRSTRKEVFYKKPLMV